MTHEERSRRLKDIMEASYGLPPAFVAVERAQRIAAKCGITEDGPAYAKIYARCVKHFVTTSAVIRLPRRPVVRRRSPAMRARRSSGVGAEDGEPDPSTYLGHGLHGFSVGALRVSGACARGPPSQQTRPF